MDSKPNPLVDIVNHLSETALNVEEEEILKEGSESYLNNCYAKLCVDRIYNINALKTILGRAWHLDNLRITKVSRNIFQILFPMEDDIRRVLIGGPWNMDNHLIILSP